MHAQLRGIVTLGLAMAATACPQASLDNADPVVERETGGADSSQPEPPEPSCEGMPAEIGKQRRPRRVVVPGHALALVSHQDKAWACGRTHTGRGFLAALAVDAFGTPTLAQQRMLDAPCHGLVLGESGIFALLDAGRVFWLGSGQAQLTGSGETVQTSITKLPAGQRWRGAWSADRGSLYLAGGEQGVVKLHFKDTALVQDFGFVGPKSQDVRDLVVRDGALVVADPKQGITVWSLDESKTRAHWRDLSYFDRPGTQRVVALGNERWAVASGHAGSYVLSYGGDSGSKTLEVVGHEILEEPAFDVAKSAGGYFSLTASRLYENQNLLYQGFPELAEQAGFESLAAGPERQLWLARGSAVELWPKPRVFGGPRVVPLLGYGTAIHGVSGNATGEMTFEVKGKGALWVKRPQALAGSGLVIEAISWPTQAPSCLEYSRFESNDRFSLRVRANNPEKLAKTVPFFLRSNDPLHGELALSVDLDSPRPRDRLGSALRRPALVTLNGHLRSIQNTESWTWLEFVASHRLADSETIEGLHTLANLVQVERRNGRASLTVSVVVGGRYPRIEPLLWSELARLQDLGLNFYFDERFSMHRSFAHLPNGRLYPLRVLVSPASKIRYYDQQLGSATAMGRYRELKHAF